MPGDVRIPVTKPPVFASARLAYSDTIRAVRAMPAMMLAAVIVSATNTLADWAFGLSLPETAPMGKVLLIKLVVIVAYSVLFAPVLIAIFRFIILDDVTRRYTLNLNDPRFQLFCGWSITFLLIAEGLGLVTRVLGIEGDVGIALDGLSVLATFVIGVVAILLLPAIAVDAPSATLRNALADVRGSFWHVFGILCLVMLPVLAVFLIVLAMNDEVAKVTTFDLTVVWFAGLAIELLVAAAASRLFEALANRLRSPAGR
jgi:hypothetical protein